MLKTLIPLRNSIILPTFAQEKLINHQTINTMSKYNQLESSKYENNEYSNMPSIDYGCSSYHIRGCNYKKDCDWDKVKEICDKYGFSYKFICSTFGGDDMAVVIYKKTNLVEDEYTRLRDGEDRKAFRELIRSFDNTFYTLHDCIHELDEETNLRFECGWGGNVGLFGSHDVSRKVYNFADWLHTYKDLANRFSPTINDTARKFGKGVYAYVVCSYFKIDEEDMFPDFTTEMALNVMREYKPNLKFEVRNGSRACDGGVTYEAIVVSSDKVGQYGSFTINKEEHDIVFMSVRVPLCGEHSRRITPQNYIDVIKENINFMVK